MKDEIWVDLIYKGFNFGEVYKITNSGLIKNLKTGREPISQKSNSVIITYNGKQQRINIPIALAESGLAEFPTKPERKQKMKITLQVPFPEGLSDGQIFRLRKDAKKALEEILTEILNWETR